MNTWTDSGLSEVGLVGAMLALGLDAPPSPAGSYAAAGPQEPPRYAQSEGPGLYPPSYPLPEPKAASEDLAGWTDGFLANGASSLQGARSWHAGPSIGGARTEPGNRHDRSTAEFSQMESTSLDLTRLASIGVDLNSLELTRLEPTRHDRTPLQPAAAGLGATDAAPLRQTPPEPIAPEPTALESTWLEPMSLESTSLDSTRLEPTRLEPTRLEPTGFGTSDLEASVDSDDSIDLGDLGVSDRQLSELMASEDFGSLGLEPSRPLAEGLEFGSPEPSALVGPEPMGAQAAHAVPEVSAATDFLAGDFGALRAGDFDDSDDADASALGSLDNSDLFEALSRRGR